MRAGSLAGVWGVWCTFQAHMAQYKEENMDERSSASRCRHACISLSDCKVASHVRGGDEAQPSHIPLRLPLLHTMPANLSMPQQVRLTEGIEVRHAKQKVLFFLQWED